MDTLVQIKSIPPWHQSTELLTSCAVLYVESVIKGNPQPGGAESIRGKQVHEVGSKYVNYCAEYRVSFDLKKFDELAAGAGPAAAKILIGMRDSYEVDFSHVLGTELTLSLDSYFLPTHLVEAIAGTCADTQQEPMVVSTLDALYAFPDEGMVRIDDLKTHPRPFDPADKIQSKVYALQVFMHWPWVEKVVFRLIFVRYKKVTREVEYTRDQVPELMAAIIADRDRQKQIHADFEAGKEVEALAGNHCQYCPLLTNLKCPIAYWNPQAQFTPQQRLNFKLFYSQFSRANNKALKDYLDGSEKKSIVLRDYNGKVYTYGPVETEIDIYSVFKFDDGGMVLRDQVNPVLPIIDLLIDYAADNPGDSVWMRNVAISSTSLKRYLKTNKRAFLDQAVEDTVVKITKTPLRVSKPLDAVPEEEDEDEEWEEQDEVL